jgi:hypothetical protein
MKYLRKFESIEDDPQIDDFVICCELPTPDNTTYPPHIKKFVDSNIGKYIKHLPNNDEYSYLIQYDNIPEEYQKDFEYNEPLNENFVPNARAMKREEIIHFSKNKKSLIPYITSIKYNF